MMTSEKLLEAIRVRAMAMEPSARWMVLELARRYEAETSVPRVAIPPSGMGDLSDGYHTFNELYHHRAVLFSVICSALPNRAWKSKRHDTGDMYDGMFIVGIETPQGQATYHYDIEPYWDMFEVKELDRAPAWDGHTPDEALARIASLAGEMVGVVRCEKCEHWEETDDGCHWMTKGRTDGVCRALLEYHDAERCYTQKEHFCRYGKRKEDGE